MLYICSVMLVLFLLLTSPYFLLNHLQVSQPNIQAQLTLPSLVLLVFFFFFFLAFPDIVLFFGPTSDLVLFSTLGLFRLILHLDCLFPAPHSPVRIYFSWKSLS